jgi:hypothetical protein
MISLGVAGSASSNTSKDLFSGTSLALDFIRDYTKTSKYQDPTKISGYTFSRASGGYAETVAGTTRFFPEMRTNLLKNSEEFNNPAWVKTATSVTTNATTAPNGTLTADKIVGDATASGHIIQQSGIASAALGT